MIYLSKNDIDIVENMLKEGKVLALPTETVYGLAVSSLKEEYFKRLVKIKNRKPDKPFTLMISDINQVKDIIEISPLADKVISKFTPGPITIILKSKNLIPSYLDLNTGYVGIRIPNDKFILSVINKLNFPLLVPSANPRDLLPATNKEEVFNYFHEDIDGIVDGEIKSNIPSTVIKIENDEIILLRKGEISLEQIKETIK